MMYVSLCIGLVEPPSASQGYVYMWVSLRVYVSVTRQECHAKDFAGAVITQCIAFAGPQSYIKQHCTLATKSQKLQ